MADIEQIEQALRRLGVRRADELAAGWAGHGFGPDEMVAWLHAGVGVDEPHIAAAMVAAEWAPGQAGPGRGGGGGGGGPSGGEAGRGGWGGAGEAGAGQEGGPRVRGPLVRWSEAGP